MERYKRKKDKLTSKIQDELVMVDIDRGQYFSLNGVGTDIWELLESDYNIDELCNELMERYDIDKETCSVETRSFITELLKLNLIEVVNE